MSKAFSVQLVRDMLHRYELSRVLDPFVASVTILVEARRMGVGVHMNPFFILLQK